MTYKQARRRMWIIGAVIECGAYALLASIDWRLCAAVVLISLSDGIEKSIIKHDIEGEM